MGVLWWDQLMKAFVLSDCQMLSKSLNSCVPSALGVACTFTDSYTDKHIEEKEIFSVTFLESVNVCEN